MLMEEKVVKTKEYLKENKKEIAVAVAGGCLCAIGCAIGWYGCRKANGLKKGMNVITNDFINQWLDHARAIYPEGTRCITFATEKPMVIDNLGELAEGFKELGAPGNATLTHFLAFGEPEKK